MYKRGMLASGVMCSVQGSLLYGEGLLQQSKLWKYAGVDRMPGRLRKPICYVPIARVITDQLEVFVCDVKSN